MYFRSSKSILLAALLIVVGTVQLMMGWSYTEVSGREDTTVGTLIRVFHGKGSTYEFSFKVNGVTIQDGTGTCRTALTPSGCTEGAAVLVYFDPERVTGALLEEFGAAGRGKIFFGSWMVACGLLLTGLHFFFKRALASPDESEETDYDKPDDGPEVIHVVPIE
jgi:hypothetical protein